MRAAFFFDTKMVRHGTDFYTGTLNYELWCNNYLPFFDDLTVHTRVCANPKSSTAGLCKSNGARVLCDPVLEYNTISDVILRNKKIKRKIEKNILSSDFVIARMPSVLGLISCSMARKLGKPYMVELVACPLDGYWNHQNVFGKVLAPIMFLATRNCIRKAPNVIYVTNQFLQKRYPTNGKAFSCSDVILPSPHDKQILEKKNQHFSNMTSKKTLTLCTVANVESKYKGQAFMIKAIPILRQKGYNVTYNLIGGGDCTRLSRLATKLGVDNNVNFIGNVNHAEVFRWLDSTDLYVQPSLQEGLSRSIIEAMSRACPIIASDVGGNSELIDRKMIFRRRKVHTLVNLIETTTLEQLAEFSAQNYLKSQEFSSDVLAKKRSIILRDILKGCAAYPKASGCKEGK